MPRHGARKTLLPKADNLLLVGLPASVQEAIAEHLRPLKLEQNTVVQEAGRPIKHVYFPSAGMISLLAVTRTGDAIETGIVGHDGVAFGNGGQLGMPSFVQGIVQIAGEGHSIRAEIFRELHDAHAPLKTAVDRYEAYVLVQAQQNAACHALHPVSARFCRWILQAQNVVGGETVNLTQEFLSHMLGVRRSSVSVVAFDLQKKGAIEYHRGRIKILDRQLLEKCSCECYAVLQRELKKHT